ncbi:uncharacterized protein LOC119014823 [Acanthopagrus latus]|uniref:uncharacterized protein LOC119014823 n=1 Tax=Acanthopagrus latus TaxID=8177 RepID=UPI00187CBC96|nr:uncharacterized protein LOC119014823 [Acanthopagrus latus]XP_036946215.1 uncharacterized protein LOC119014823 [Acanthopagrus latus]XP_036946216.1 uncharacterized protein LOC119014823 [Acanthopagrus latus]
MLRILVILTFFHFGETKDCSVVNIYCPDIKTDNGFKFPYNCSNPAQNGSTEREVEISDNKTMIARGPSLVHSPHVTNMDNNSITTAECRDLHVKCIIHGRKVKESCWVYVTTGNMTPMSPDPIQSPDPADPPPTESPEKVPSWVYGLIGIIVIIVIIGILCHWKKKVKTLCTDLLVRIGLRTSQAGRETAGETGEPLSATHQQACDDNNHNAKLESVCTLSIDPEPDGETPPSSGLDRTLSNGRIQEPKNFFRSMRDDPGGVNDNKGKGRLRNGEMCNGWARGDRGPADENGGQPLLQNQRAANPDMTGEAGLVNERGFGTQQVRWCSTAPDADVESTLNMKNTMTDYYY